MPAYKLEVDERFEDLLDSAVRSKSIAPEANTKSEVIRRAVALYVYLHEQVFNEGLRVALIDKNSNVVTIIDPLP